ncbi:MAG TPA: N-acetyl-gamma-glutamyl-phosphate reductase [Abditibacteriaceae bacterium]|jgi:N-acetyl-gamma-glutamyl-phosphate reductase
MSAKTLLRAGVIGASGYGGAELARLLAAHPHAEITAATASAERAGAKLSDLFPSLRGVCDIVCEAFDADHFAAKCDVAFLALPHGKAFDMVPALLNHGVKVIDIGADFRLRDVEEYRQWYKLDHGAPELLTEAVYGLPEWNREEIRGARLVANPGCYPTSAILALAPFVAAEAIDLRSIIVDSASGTSGAGRSSFGLGMHFPELHGDYKAYNVAAHRHTPEIEQGLRDAVAQGASGSTTEFHITFTAHLLPIARGILSTSYATLSQPLTTEGALEILNARYANEPFVRVHPLGELPQIKHVAGSNFCDIGVKVDSRTGRLIVVSAEDNLIKGAAGQAIQNMNLMSGFDESAGLRLAPLFP